jgi:quercetin 2,3-dioxygenase
MTSGGGIAHSEETPAKNSGVLNGVQLWVALPNADRNGEASFQYIQEVPVIEQGGGTVSTFAGGSSPAKHFSPVLGTDIAVYATASVELPLDHSFEHAALLMTGDVEIDGQSIDSTSLWYLGTNRSSIEFKSRNGCRVLLIGGLPFPETILMWWNFVARTPEEIEQAVSDWRSHERFGEVKAYRGPRLDAPPVQKFAAPNPAS